MLRQAVVEEFDNEDIVVEEIRIHNSLKNQGIIYAANK